MYLQFLQACAFIITFWSLYFICETKNNYIANETYIHVEGYVGFENGKTNNSKWFAFTDFLFIFTGTKFHSDGIN